MKNKNKEQLEKFAYLAKRYEPFNTDTIIGKYIKEHIKQQPQLVRNYFSYDTPFTVSVTPGKALTDITIPDFNIDDIYLCGYEVYDILSDRMVPVYNYAVFIADDISKFHDYFKSFSNTVEHCISKSDVVGKFVFKSIYQTFNCNNVIIESIADNTVVLHADQILTIY